jgi:NhaP-type Na+/H+ or K+/H+ antiporter
MIINLAILVILGLIFNYLFTRIKLPGLLGMLLVGILCGPYVLNIMDPSLLDESAGLRKVALIVILLRAGLELRKDVLKKIGKRAFMLTCIPSSIEALVITFIAPLFLHISYLESAILACTIAAVSPAVVVPYMIKLMARKIGSKKSIPTMIMASSAGDNIFVITVFTTIVGFYVDNHENLWTQILQIPENILLGILSGLLLGWILVRIFHRFNPRATKMALTVIAMSIVLTWIEDDLLTGFVQFSALLAIMTIGYVILNKDESRAHDISNKLSKIWVFAEIILFVLVGAAVNINVIWQAGLIGLIIITLGLIGRSIGTYFSVSGAGYTLKEKLFCVISYLPKATVQAAIGAIPLEMGIPGGEIILAIAVLSIIVTAPIGAISIKLTAEKFLTEPEIQS